MKRLQFLGIIFLLAAVTSFIGCLLDELVDDEGDTFVPVTKITGVPDPWTGTVGTAITLAGTVVPSKATNKTITKWTVTDAGTTGGTVTGNKVTAKAPGTLKVTATIADGKAQGKAFTQNFSITFTNPFPVTGITGVPTTGTVGTTLTLGGTVQPANANKTISWSINSAGTTATVTMSGNTVTATAPGTLKVTATIENGTAQGTAYTEDFVIEFPFVQVSNITIVPADPIDPTSWKGTVGTALTLAGTVEPSDASYKDIVWTVTDDGGTGIPRNTEIRNGNTVTATAPGTLKVTATIVNGKAQGSNFTSNEFSITFPFVPVTAITGVPSTWPVDKELTLAGTVQPTNATNKEIIWEVTNDGGTEATLTDVNKLTATEPGTLVVTATIVDGNAPGTPYTKHFFITCNPFQKVNDITVITKIGEVGKPLTLTGTVTPSDATDTNIIWEVRNAGTTGIKLGIISGNKVTAEAAGTLLVSAYVANGVAPSVPHRVDARIEFIEPVTNITDVPTEGIVGTDLTLTGTVEPTDATKKLIEWRVTQAVPGIPTGPVTGNIRATAAGTLKGTATIKDGIVEHGEFTNYTQNFEIEFVADPSASKVKR